MDISWFNFQKKESASQPDEATKVSEQDLTTPAASTKTPFLIDSLINGFNPAEFMTRKGFNTIDKMLKDEHIYGILEMKKYFILSTGYDFVLDSKDKNSNEILDFVKLNFESKYQGLLIRDIHQILSAFEYGFSVTEKLYRKDKDRIYLYRLKTIPPHGIFFTTDDRGNLARIQQFQMSGQKDLPIYKMLHFTQNQNFDNPFGKTDMERCYRSWFAKDFIIKMWTVYLQRFASPFPVGTVPNDAGQDRVDEMIAVLDSIQQAVSLVIPEGAKIELHKSGSNSGGEYDAAIDRFNQMIARSMLVPDLVGFGQSTTGGSYSLGRKHFDVFMSICGYVRKSIEELINEQCIKQLVDINFGEQEIYPQFRFSPYENEDLTEMIKLFLDAFDKGMPATIEDFDHFRGLINFPELDKTLPIIESKKATPPQGGMVAPAPVAHSAQEPVVALSVEPNRAPDKYELRVDFVSEAKNVDSINAKIIDRMAALMGSMRTVFKRDIIKRNIIGSAAIGEVAKLTLKNKGDLKRILEDGLGEVYSLGRTNAGDEIAKFSEAKKAVYAAKRPVKITDTRIISKQAGKVAEELITAQAFQSIGTVGDELLNQSKQSLISGIQLGKSEKEIMKDIDTIWNGVTQGSAAAGLSTTPGRLQVIVRTNSTNVYNLARKQEAGNPDLEGFIWGYEFSAIMDDRTTDICAELDGLIAPIDDPAWDFSTPPMHYNCRSVLRYITQVDVEQDNLSPDDFPSATTLADDFPESKDFV